MPSESKGFRGDSEVDDESHENQKPLRVMNRLKMQSRSSIFEPNMSCHQEEEDDISDDEVFSTP